jgi:hypothetical protein
MTIPTLVRIFHALGVHLSITMEPPVVQTEDDEEASE